MRFDKESRKRIKHLRSKFWFKMVVCLASVCNLKPENSSLYPCILILGQSPICKRFFHNRKASKNLEALNICYFPGFSSSTMFIQIFITFVFSQIIELL